MSLVGSQNGIVGEFLALTPIVRKENMISLYFPFSVDSKLLIVHLLVPKWYAGSFRSRMLAPPLGLA
jgi:hypothetical protein